MVQLTTYTANQLRLNTATRSAYLYQKEITLTGLEFNLLKIIIMNAGHIVTRAEIAEAIFHKKTQQCNSSINSHMLNIRKKISRLSREEYIKTVRGKGYILLQ